MRGSGPGGHLDALAAGGHLARLPDSALRLWCLYQSCADVGTGAAWPSAERIAAATGLRDRAVTQGRRTLREAGLISVVADGRGRGRCQVVRVRRADEDPADVDALDARAREQAEQAGIAPAAPAENPHEKTRAVKPAPQNPFYDDTKTRTETRVSQHKEEQARIEPLGATAPKPPSPPGDAPAGGEGAAKPPGRNRARRPRRGDRRPRDRRRAEIHTAFVRLFCERLYPARHDGERFEFRGARDAAAVQRLLASRKVRWHLPRAVAVAAGHLADAQPRFHTPDQVAGGAQHAAEVAKRFGWLRELVGPDPPDESDDDTAATLVAGEAAAKRLAAELHALPALDRPRTSSPNSHARSHPADPRPARPAGDLGRTERPMRDAG